MCFFLSDLLDEVVLLIGAVDVELRWRRNDPRRDKLTVHLVHCSILMFITKMFPYNAQIFT